MFWRMTGLSAASPVESVLDKENFTLEELFDEEEIIQECKALNSRLINFLRDRAQVKQMLHYIVEDPPEDSEKRRAYKFPFVACEIFTCEIDVILKTLVEDEELMNLLFSFLEPNRTHCTLLAGYFSKVVVCLMLRKTIPLMNYVQAHQEIFGRLVDLIGITSIMEVLVRLVGADDHMYTNFTDVMQWLADTNLLEMIADKLSPSNSPEVHANAAETLCAITRNSSSALAAKISTPSFVGRIFGHALEHAPSRSSLVHSLSVCISLLDPRRAALAPPGHLIRGQHLFDPPFSANPETVSGMLLKLGDLLMLLNVSSDESVLPTTYGELCPPLGKHRLKIVEFIAVLLRTGSDIAEKELVSSGAIHRILDLFFEFPFNNSLHHHVESIIMSCLESKNSTLIDHLFKECDLIGKVLSADKNPTLSSDTNGPTMPAPGRPSPRIGNIGHLTRMANKLVQLGNSNSQVQAYLQENGEWIEWHANVLLKRNTVENVYQWTCGRPSSLQDRMRDSDEDDIRDRDYDVAALANNLSQAFRYGMYENDDGEEVHGSLDRDEEDVYFDDDSAEVVISSLRLGDDQENGCLFTNSNWFAFQDDRIVDEPLSTSQPSRMEEINLNGTEGTVNSGGSSSSDDEVVVGEDEELLDTANSSERRSLSWVTENGLSNGRDPSSLTANLEKAGTSDVSLFGSDQREGETSGVRSPVDWVAWQGELGKGEAATSNAKPVSPSNGKVEASESPTNGSGCCEGFDRPAENCRTVTSLFDEDVEFVGVELEGTEKAMEHALKEGIVGEAGPLKRNLVACPDQKIVEDESGKNEYNDANFWRVEQEVTVVKE